MKIKEVTNMKKALIVVSFGTSYEQAEQAIINVEEKLKEAFAEYDFNRAFTSGMIMKKIWKTRHIKIENTKEVLERLKNEGYQEILCQPTHVINGVEYEKMKEMLMEYKDQFDSIHLGSPLLTVEEDFSKCGKIVMDQINPLKDNEAFVLMGHGTDHFANGAYAQFENMLRFLGYENVYVGTVEGFPNLDYVIQRLKPKKIEKIYLMPLMIVAGDHAQNDLAGYEEDSWKSILNNAGYKTEIILKGLGEYEEIAQLFVEHLRNAEVL